MFYRVQPKGRSQNDKSRPSGRPLSCCNLYEILAPAVGIEPTTN